MSDEDVSDWQERLKLDRDVRTRVMAWGEANLEAYAPDADDDPKDYGSKLNTNRDFTLVERKKADLFFQRPDVIAIPSPLMEGSEAILDTHTTILNHALGLDGVNAKLLVHQALFDVLCTVGTGFTVMGYESATIDTPGTHPVTGQPISTPVPVYENCFWKTFSPKQAIIPHDFRSTVWDDAPYLGYDFEIPVRQAKRKGWVPDDFAGSQPDPELHFDSGTTETGSEGLVKGTLIYYKSALFRDDVVHPQHLTELVLIDGRGKSATDTVAVHKDCPHQTLNPDGSLSADSMLGNPIHPMTLRTLTDSAWVPSDCTVSRPIVNELNTFRRQMVEQRDGNLTRYVYNTDVLPTDALAKIVRSPIAGFIGLPGEAYAGEGAVKELPHGTFPRENFQFNDYLDNDLARTHALDASQSGADNSGGAKTATEEQIKQSNVSARLGLERGMVLDWYVKGVEKYSTLIQRYYTVQMAAAIVGPQAAQAWDPWRKQVPSSLAFTAHPDSTLRMDLSSDRQRKMQEYTFFANDPFINRQVLLKHLVTNLGYPQTVVNPQPPPKGPEPTKPTFSFKGDDLNPLAPQFAIVIEILKQSGVTIDPAAIQQAQAGAQNALLAGHVVNQAQPGMPGQPQTAHGGKLPAMEGLSKHAAELTGGMQGTGKPAPMGPGGSIQ
jgi:hypothetical protein